MALSNRIPCVLRQDTLLTDLNRPSVCLPEDRRRFHTLRYA